MTNAETVAANIVQREGMPTAADVGDGAGVTQIGGQTTGWLQQWGLPVPHSEAEAATNIQSWLAQSGLMQVVHANLALGDCLSDWAYNSGTRPAVKALQTILGVAVDGILGKETIQALAAHAPEDLSGFVRDLTKARVLFLARAFASGSVSPTFAVGLLSRALLFL